MTSRREQVKIPQTPKRVVTLTILLIVVAACGSYAGNRYFQQPVAPPAQEAKRDHLFAPVAALQFSEVSDVEKVDLVVPIQNISDEPVDIVRLVPSCACTVASFQPGPLLPGSSIHVKVTINVDPWRANLDTEGRTAVSTSIAAEYRTPGNTTLLQQTWQIAGRVRQTISAAPDLWWGNIPESAPQGPHQLRASKIVVYGSLGSLQVTEPSSVIAVALKPDGRDFEILVGPGATPRLGPFDEVVSVRARTPDGRAVHQSLRIRGVIVPDVLPDAPELPLGGKEAGEVSVHTVKLRAANGLPFTVVDVVPEGSGLSVASGGTANEYVVTQRITEIGGVQNRVRFVVRTDRGLRTVSVPVTYTGVPVAKP